MNPFKIIANLFQDELHGHWETNNDGGFQVMMGARITFKKDCSGLLESWGENFEESSLDEFFWERVSSNQIKIRKVSDPHWTAVTYKIGTYTDPYNLKFRELFETSQRIGDIPGFWIVPGELYKRA